MSKEKKVKRGCNQCSSEMERPWSWHEGILCCVNPACPNYALLQIPLEQMPKEKK